MHIMHLCVYLHFDDTPIAELSFGVFAPVFLFMFTFIFILVFSFVFYFYFYFHLYSYLYFHLYSYLYLYFHLHLNFIKYLLFSYFLYEQMLQCTWHAHFSGRGARCIICTMQPRWLSRDFRNIFLSNLICILHISLNI